MGFSPWGLAIACAVLAPDLGAEAILPVAVFFSAGAWLSNVWIIAAALILAAGHVSASLVISARGLR